MFRSRIESRQTKWNRVYYVSCDKIPKNVRAHVRRRLFLLIDNTTSTVISYQSVDLSQDLFAIDITYLSL